MRTYSERGLGAMLEHARLPCGVLVLAAVCGAALTGCGGNSACDSAKTAASSYLADYQAGKSAAAAYTQQVAALPSYPSEPLAWVTHCDLYAPGPIIPANVVNPNCPATVVADTIEWEKALQTRGVGAGLRLGADVAAVKAFENAVALPAIAQMNAIRSAIPQPQRSTDEDAKLFDAVVDGNPTCFSAQVRAQVKVNEG